MSQILPPEKPITKRLPIDKLEPMPHNPRKRRTDEHVEDLMQSMARLGQLVPILIRKHPQDAQRFEVVAGLSRLEAARRLGWTRIDCYHLDVLDGDDERAYQAAAFENLDRVDLSPYEETIAVLRVLDAELAGVVPNWPREGEAREQLRYTMEFVSSWVRSTSEASRHTIARLLRVEPAVIQRAIDDVFRRREGLQPKSFASNRRRLLDLGDDVLELLEAGAIGYKIALEIDKARDPAQRTALLDKARAGGSLRELRQEVKRTKNRNDPPQVRERSATLGRVQKRLKKAAEKGLDDREWDALVARLDDAFARVDV